MLAAHSTLLTAQTVATARLIRYLHLVVAGRMALPLSPVKTEALEVEDRGPRVQVYLAEQECLVKATTEATQAQLVAQRAVAVLERQVATPAQTTLVVRGEMVLHQVLQGHQLIMLAVVVAVDQQRLDRVALAAAAMQ